MATIIRETPAPEPLQGTLHDPTHPRAEDEPILEVDEIQGNILGGFSKDHQMLLFLKITNVANFKGWLKAVTPFVATASEVISFNRLFKSLRVRQGKEGAVKSTWINLAFTYTGMHQLAASDLLEADFTDPSFKQGLAARSPALGDPTQAANPGNPAHWVVGGTATPVDAVILVASDDAADLDRAVKRFENPDPADAALKLAGATIVYHQPGNNLPGKLSGHEHFGFLDGVSQPGIRGRVSDAPGDVLTPRQNPNDRGQGKPGQDLLWPGEFVFGYPRQDAEAASIAEPGPLSTAGPHWSRNGSYLVFRRLKQDVFGFHSFLKATAAAHAAQGAGSAEAVGARLVGRWPSGAPVLRTPRVTAGVPDYQHLGVDTPGLGDDDCANNHFEFQDGTALLPPAGNPSPFDCVDDFFTQSEGDKSGLLCPFAGHIRKAYPRDDEQRPLPPCSNTDKAAPDGSEPNEEDTQTHRLLRRGIPFGKASTSTPSQPVADNGDRGLLFLAYQTSIERQFEFVTRNWVNEPNFKDPGSGFDFILGQNNHVANRQRTMKVKFGPAANQCVTLTTQTDWVIPTGGGYFFAPSISALALLAG